MTNTAANAKGQTIDMDAAAMLMDAEIRESLNSSIVKLGINNETDFLAAYAAAHEAKFGEEFAPYVGGAW